ncbi:4-(cytidine 5'-diphospho)-2-C-methyl-D-erythritol kinase [Bacillus tianshenii]|nr:4-(cytidine 5'-diphospho)-2-C-methyl-D-erythritol kinase [Bacillus tianshenii]
MKILVKAPAKINLALDVLHKRDDGFHEVEMIMTTVDLADRIELEDNNSGIIKLSSQNRFVPNDERNLAFQAAKLLKDRYHINRGLNISMAKTIPVAAGLAGGSSDAAAVLRGLNQLWNLGLSLDELAELGSEIGSDVSFCVHGGTALATGRGEKIKKLPSPPSCWVILAKPTIGVSTAEVYKHLDLSKVEHPDVEGMIEAIEEKNFEKMCSRVGNVLETVTFKRYPEVQALKEQIQRFGADAVLMSGSGPTVFALAQYESRMHRIYNGLRGFCDQVFAVRMLGDGMDVD